MTKNSCRIFGDLKPLIGRSNFLECRGSRQSRCSMSKSTAISKGYGLDEFVSPLYMHSEAIVGQHVAEMKARQSVGAAISRGPPEHAF